MIDAKISIEYVIEVAVPDNEIINRLTGRRIHLASGRIYHIKYDPPENENIDDQVNKDMVSVEALSSKDLVKIKEVLTRHVEATNSRRGLILLRTFDEIKDRFIKIVPKEISRILESKGINIDDFDFINPNLGEV
jgi:adenylate kinase family enzyme